MERERERLGSRVFERELYVRGIVRYLHKLSVKGSEREIVGQAFRH